MSIERLLGSPKADAQVIANLLAASRNDACTVSAIDLVLERFRDRSLPAPLEESLRDRIKIAFNSLTSRSARINAIVTIVQAYCGDQGSLKNALEWARSGTSDDRLGDRAIREDLRLRAVQAILYRKIQGMPRSLIGAILAEDDSQSSAAFRSNVLDSLSGVDDPDVAFAVLRAYANLPAELKPKAVNLLTHRGEWTKSLLETIADGRLPKSVLNVTHLRKLQQTRDPQVAAQVKALWGTIRDRRDPKRERVSVEIRALVRKTPGNPVSGHAVFKRVCAVCHKIYGEGQDVGPDLTSNGRNDFDQLISNVFDPNMVIGPGYQATTIATSDGRILSGLLVENGKERVILKLQGGKAETIQRSQVEEMKTGELSLMPDSFETQLTPQDIVDLCAFLSLDKPPSDPSANALPGSGPMVRASK